MTKLVPTTKFELSSSLVGIKAQVLVTFGYRCPDGPDAIGGTMHDTIKHGTNTMS